MKSSSTKMTYDLYRLMPDDGKRYELIEGELVMVPAPTPQHQRTVRRLLVALTNYVEANGLGEVFDSPIDVVFDEHLVLQPDIIFVSRERQERIGEEAIHGAPDVAIEVLSPSSFYHDLRRKMRFYSRYNVQEYWIVDPENRTMDLYTRAGEELKLCRQFALHETFESPLLPGFRLAIVTIFQE